MVFVQRGKRQRDAYSHVSVSFVDCHVTAILFALAVGVDRATGAKRDFAHVQFSSYAMIVSMMTVIVISSMIVIMIFYCDEYDLLLS